MIPRIFLLLAALAQFTIPQHTGVNASTGGPCSGQPAFSLQLESSTPTGTGGAPILTWNDTSGNGDNVSFAGSSIVPGIDKTNNTPNGTQTIQMGGNQTGVLSSVLANSDNMTVCASYKLTDTTSPHAFTTDGTGGGGFNYNAVGSDGSPQYFNVSFVSFVAAAALTPPETEWESTCVSTQMGVSAAFYRWDASNSGADITTTFDATQHTTKGIGMVFTDNLGTSPMEGSIAELDIIAGTAITPTQAEAIHSCYVHKYGVP